MTEVAVPLIPLTADGLPAFMANANPITSQWIIVNGFTAAPGTQCLLPDPNGGIAAVLTGINHANDLYALASLPMSLPPGLYALASGGISLDAQKAALGFALGSYQFTRYRKPKREPARLEMPGGVNADELQAIVNAVNQTRDWVNTPAEDLGPEEFSTIAKKIALAQSADYREWVGEELLVNNFPAIYAVGRASHRLPRLIEIHWGNLSHPLVSLIGKGVCFDTGGLDIKAADGMRNMKKDMGGAAHALALGNLIMSQCLPVRLQIVLPVVENAIAANAYRPGDVLKTRKGLSVEIDNTDAEGRVVLGDALAYAAENNPELMIDFATLTGAARIALGADLPPVFSNCDPLRDAAVAAGKQVQDSIWPMPLWQPYQNMLDSSVADLANSGPSRYAGCITAALYLQRFVPDSIPWLHLDTYAWNDVDRPGRPKGGEALGLRAIYELLRQKYP